MASRFGFSRRVFRRIRPLYPRSVRDGNEDELEVLFVSALERERERRGWLGIAYVWWGTVVDMVVNREQRSMDRHKPPRRRWRWLGDARGDVRHGVATLRRQPLFAFLVIMTLTVGIGANVVMFALVHGVLLRPLPFPESTDLVKVWSSNPDQGLDREGPSPADVLDFQERTVALEGLAAWFMTSGTYQEPGYAEEVIAAQVTGNFFEILGVEAAVGRVFRPVDVVAAFGPLVISHDFWQQRFGGDSSVVGRSVIVSGHQYSVIGVMPRDFTFPDRTVQHWLAWDMRRGYAHLPELPRTWRFLDTVGRMAPHATHDLVEQDLQRIAGDLAQEFAGSNAGWSVRVASLFDETVGEVRTELVLAQLAVGLVLILACVNVANMLLARLPARAQEFALRAALGAGRGRLVRQVMAELVVLVGIASAGGLALASLLLHSLVTLNAEQVPRLDGVRINLPIVAFTLGLVVLVTLLSGLAPAFALGSLTRRVTRSGAPGIGVTSNQQRLRAGLVVVQLALAVTLLVGAGLFGRSLQLLSRFDLGYDAENVVSFRLSLNSRPGDTQYTARYYRAVIDSMAALPGVNYVGAVTTLPLDPVGNDFSRPYRVAGGRTPSAEAPKAQVRIVTPDLFRALAIPVLTGRSFSETEPLAPLSVIVNRTLAQRHWGTTDVVGRTIEIDFREGWQPYTVIGVVGDVHHYGARRAAEAEVFLSNRQVPYLAMSVVVRSNAQPERLIPLIQTKLREIDAGQPAHHFTTLARVRAESMAEERFFVMVFGAFACIALVLAATGVYGVVAYEVTLRTQEVGVRMALGAHPNRLAFSVLRRAMTLAIIGTAIGLVVASRLGILVAAVLYGVAPHDVGVMTAVCLILLLVAAAAAFAPARRVTRVDPVRALRPN